MSRSGVVFNLTYSHSSGASGSLVSSLARLTLKEEVNGRLHKDFDKFNDKAPNPDSPVLTHTRSFGSGETDVSRLASRSSCAGSSGAAILSSRTLENKTGT